MIAIPYRTESVLAMRWEELAVTIAAAAADTTGDDAQGADFEIPVGATPAS